MTTPNKTAIDAAAKILHADDRTARGRGMLDFIAAREESIAHSGPIDSWEDCHENIRDEYREIAGRMLASGGFESLETNVPTKPVAVGHGPALQAGARVVMTQLECTQDEDEDMTCVAHAGHIFTDGELCDGALEDALAILNAMLIPIRDEYTNRLKDMPVVLEAVFNGTHTHMEVFNATRDTAVAIVLGESQ